jgi:hypothetical protein
LLRCKCIYHFSERTKRPKSARKGRFCGKKEKSIEDNVWGRKDLDDDILDYFNENNIPGPSQVGMETCLILVSANNFYTSNNMSVLGGGGAKKSALDCHIEYVGWQTKYGTSVEHNPHTFALALYSVDFA